MLKTNDCVVHVRFYDFSLGSIYGGKIKVIGQSPIFEDKYEVITEAGNITDIYKKHLESNDFIKVI